MRIPSKSRRIGLYIRVSTEEQAQNPEGSIKSQEQRLRQHLELKNQDTYLGEVSHVFVDRARSGKDLSRPELQRMLALIQASEIDLVMVSELSRLSRSIKDFSSIWEMMKQHDCGFLSLRENFDTTTAAGEMVLYTVANIAQFERLQCSERISANFLARAERGLYNGGSVPLGYRLNPERKGYLSICDEEACVVREAFRSFLDQGCLSKAGLSLNQRGFYPTRHRLNGNRKRTGHFTFGNLHDLLTNPAYVGLRRYRDKEDKEKTTRACWEPIIEREAFERVQQVLKQNRYRYKPHTARRYPYLFSGLVHCGQCGDRMCGKTAHGNGGKVGYYEHGWAQRRQAYLNKKIFECRPHRVLAKRLEPVVWQDIHSLLSNVTEAKGMAKLAQECQSKRDDGNEVASFANQIRDVEIQLEALAEHLAQIPKGVSPQPVFSQMEKMQAKKTELQEKRSDAERRGGLGDAPVNAAEYWDYLSAVRTSLDCGGEEAVAKTKAARKLIHRILVYPTEIKLEYKVGRTTLGIVRSNKTAEEKNITNFGSTRLQFGGA